MVVVVAAAIVVVVGNAGVVLVLDDVMSMVTVDLESVENPNGLLTPNEGISNVFFLFQ